MKCRKVNSTIEHGPPGRLVLYENNARTHSSDQIEQIANSIKQVGAARSPDLKKAYELLARTHRIDLPTSSGRGQSV
jgi:hypothetical protein